MFFQKDERLLKKNGTQNQNLTKNKAPNINKCGIDFYVFLLY